MTETSSPPAAESTRPPRVVPHGIVWPFILLSSLFLAWAIPNNMTDTMLAAFKRIMSLSDSRTAWIQIACYFCGYGCFALPGAIFIKKHTYKSGVLLGLGLFAGGAMLIYPAGLAAGLSMYLCFMLFLVSLVILFAGLSILETATNSYVCAIGSEVTATQRLNFAQSFNPFGAIIGVVASQVFVLSKLNVLTAEQRQALPAEQLAAIQRGELHAVTTAYLVLGLIMAGLFLAIYVTRMPNLKEDDKSLNLKKTFGRLLRNGNYVWGVIAQFFYVGAQIAVWSYIIRYVLIQMDLDAVVASLGENATPEAIIEKLRGLEPVAAGFYNICEWVGLDALLPRTAHHVTDPVRNRSFYLHARHGLRQAPELADGPVRYRGGMLSAHDLREGIRGHIRVDDHILLHVPDVPDHLRPGPGHRRFEGRHEGRRLGHGDGHRRCGRFDADSRRRLGRVRQHQSGLLGPRHRVHRRGILWSGHMPDTRISRLVGKFKII